MQQMLNLLVVINNVEFVENNPTTNRYVNVNVNVKCKWYKEVERE
jgi:hypothetical protein